MPAKTPKLDGSTNLGLHLAAGLADNYITEAQYILDDNNKDKDGNQQSIQDTIDGLVKAQETQEWATKQDIGGLFVECDEVVDYNEENKE